MKKIINVSNRIITVGNTKLLPMQSMIVDDNMLNYYGARIQSLASIGIIKIFDVPSNNIIVNVADEADEVQIPKKKNKIKE